jgi:hypothetical protein
MATSESPNSPSSKKAWTLTERVDALIKLKDFAVRNGYSLPESIIEQAVSLETLRQSSDQVVFDEKTSTKVDNLAIELSQITYPVNLDNVKNVHGVTAFVYILLAIALLASLLSGILIWLIEAGRSAGSSSLCSSLLALLLGTVGAIVYVMLPNGKLNVFAGVDEASNDTVRVAMGAILGFVLYIAVGLARPASNMPSQDVLRTVAPFIGGYSITLVVGILAKAVAAIALTFGIDEKSIRSSLHR